VQDIGMGERRSPGAAVKLAVVVSFSALIALGTVFSIPAPQPLGEITWAPAIYMALSLLVDTPVSFTATAVGSFIGESYGVAFKGFPPIYAPGIVWARAPETLIIGWARRRSRRAMVAAMVGATVFETLAFFFPDWAFYTYGLFGYGLPTDVVSGFYSASFDLLTMVDVVFIPVALGIVKAARPAFRRLGFE
jgi:hypothetical protein